ncbi:inner nuclear membrane protein enriched at telomere/subtelomere region [Podila humilis]|nr:inner nuclear membrane protein enriched at telomere/subtelomere region [Podila humilis]
MNDAVLTFREYDFNDHSVKSLEIYEDPTGALRGGVGSTIWDAAIVLSKYLEKSSLYATVKKGEQPVQVLELGSGTGIVGLVVARLLSVKGIPGKVVLTDKGSVLPLLQKNTDHNVSEGVEVAAQVLDWETISGIRAIESKVDDDKPTDDSPTRTTGTISEITTMASTFANQDWDLVILSDCIWVPGLYASLVGTLEKLILLPSTQLLIAFEKRNFSEEMEFFARLGKTFRFRDIKPEEQDDNWQTVWWCKTLSCKTFAIADVCAVFIFILIVVEMDLAAMYDRRSYPDQKPVTSIFITTTSAANGTAQYIPLTHQPVLRPVAYSQQGYDQTQPLQPLAGYPYPVTTGVAYQFPEPLDKKKTKKSSNFSDENPFQSGNDSERTRSKSRDSTTTTTSRTRSTSRSKKAAATGKESVRPPVFKEPELPAFGRYMHTPEIPSDKEISVYPTSPSLRKRSKRVEVDHPKPKPFNITAKEEANFLDQDWGQYLTLIGCTLAAVLLSYILWYRQTRFHIGFCPASVDQNTSQSGSNCIPCPDHAVCLTPDSDPVCSPEYILKPQLLSFGGLLPLSPVCVLNRAKEYQSFQIADAAERWVHNYGGKAECGFTPLAPKVKLARQRILEKDLQQHMEQLKESTVSETDFQEYWDMAMKELHRRADKVVFEKTEDGNVTIRSLKPRKTIACRLRQALFAWIVKFKFAFSCMVLSLIGAIVLRRKIVQRQKRNRIVNGLVANVLSKLSNQAHYYYVDPVLYSEPFLPQLHLRDALLANVHSPVERQELWTRVESIVEKNSNVRIGSQEVRGEPHRTWEWIGASNILGDSSYDAIGDKQNGVRRGIDGGMGVGTSVGSSSSYARGNVPAVPTRTGPHGSFFGMRRVDSEFMNPLNPMYPSLSQEYDSYERE